MGRVTDWFTAPETGVIREVAEIEAVGHRMVHGGEKFTQSALCTPEVVQEIEDCCELAPLHNPHNLRGYHAAYQTLPDVPHAAVFDTSLADWVLTGFRCAASARFGSGAPAVEEGFSKDFRAVERKRKTMTLTMSSRGAMGFAIRPFAPLRTLLARF